MSGGRPNAQLDLLRLLHEILNQAQSPNDDLSPSHQIRPERVINMYFRDAPNPPKHMLGDTYKFNNELYTIIRGAYVPTVQAYVYQFVNSSGFMCAQTDADILGGAMGEPMPIDITNVNNLITINRDLKNEILTSMNDAPAIVSTPSPEMSRMNNEMPCRHVTAPRPPSQASSGDWGPIGVDPRWYTSSESEIVNELRRNSPDHMKPENIMFKTFGRNQDLPAYLLGDVLQITNIVCRIVNGVQIANTWYYELSFENGGRGIFTTDQLNNFTRVIPPQNAGYNNQNVSGQLREQYNHPLYGVRMARFRRNQSSSSQTPPPISIRTPQRTPQRTSQREPPQAPRVQRRSSPNSFNPVSSQGAQAPPPGRPKPRILLGDLFQSRISDQIFLVTNGRWKTGSHGLDPSGYVYDMVSTDGGYALGWSALKINSNCKPVRGGRNAAAAAHPLYDFPITNESRQEIISSRDHQHRLMSGWISRPQQGSGQRSRQRSQQAQQAQQGRSSRRRILYNTNTAPGDPSPVFNEQKEILNGNGNTSSTPVINKLAVTLKNGRSHPGNPPPPDLAPGSGVKYDPRYIYGQFFKKGVVYYVVLGGEWINGEWVYVLMGSDGSMHRHTESQIKQIEREMPDGSFQVIPPQARLVGVSLGRDQDKNEFIRLAANFRFVLGYFNDMWNERKTYEYQMDELFLRGKHARAHTSVDEAADTVLEESKQEYYRREQKRRSAVATAHGDDFYVKKQLDKDLKHAQKPVKRSNSRSSTRRRRKEREDRIIGARRRKENYESREGSKQLAKGQAAINAEAKHWWEQNKEEHKCTICLDGFDDEDVNYIENGKLFYAVQLRCGHWFHYNCIKMSQKPKTGPIDYQWAINNVRQRKFMDTLTCPVCRTPAVDDSFGDNVYRLQDKLQHINLRF